MVPNASNKRPSFANGPRIVVASNASGIMSVTCGGREHVAADNTDEVNEHDATGHKSLVLENGVAGSGFVAEGDAGGLTQRKASGHENKPQLREFAAQYSASGGSPDDCFALRNDAKLTLRELAVGSTVRVCVYWVLLLLLGLCGIAAPHGEHLPRCMRVTFLITFLLLVLFLCCFSGMIRTPIYLMFGCCTPSWVMCFSLFCLLFFCQHAVPASLLCVPRTARKGDWRNRPDAAMKCERCCVVWWNSTNFFCFIQCGNHV
ncbi:hypothetical protein TCSYLVIO_006736 [Trypanosoma cruzi]|nr:hypothetical protein TCSYLVIO_006736 [Trypanosoma cruzi]